MSDRDARMPELSPTADAAWHAFAGSIAPDDGAQARVLQRVRARTTERSAAAVDDDEEPNGSRTARRAAAAVLVVKSSAITVSLAGGALLGIKLIAAAVHVPSAPSPPTEASAVRDVAPVAPAPVVPAPPPPSTSAPPPSDVPATAVVAPSSATSAAKPPRVASAPASATGPDLLQAEIELIGRARAAVRTGEHARAIELLETHRTGFPNGALVEERLAYHAIAACKLGRADGSERAQRFAKAYPRSSQLAAVRAACAAGAIDAMDPATRQQ